MAWYAKPSGGYSMSSTEGTSNILEIAALYRARGYTDEAIAGVLGNMNAESAFNPWRWQSDVVNYSGGYGLYQYTPARGYINLTGVQYHAPNLSTSSQTAGAQAADGIAQVMVQINDTLGKWVSYCWRDDWIGQAALRAYRDQVVAQYGSGNRLTQVQFARIDDIRAATFAFLACFEGPAYPNLETRVAAAQQAYQIIQGQPPTPPTPTGNIPKWLLFKIKWR